MLSDEVDLTRLRVGLEAWLGRRLPEARDLSVSRLERAGAGFTNVSLPFDLRWREAGRERVEPMIFRGAGRSEPVYPDAKLERQFRVMQCLAGSDVPVPRVFWYEPDAGPVGMPFYLMGRIEGEVPSEFPPYHSFGVCRDAPCEQRARMWWETIDAMARLHRLDWQARGLAFLGAPPGGAAALEPELDYWDAYLEWAREEPQPLLATGLEWLRRNRYAPPRIRLCWGDARMPNAIFGPGGELRGLLDWDMAILSDPESDLAFFLTLDHLLGEGTGAPRLPGLPGREETLARYQERVGWQLENFHYNEVFAALRAGVVILRVQHNLRRRGIEIPGEDPMRDNMCTRLLARRLGLPSPGAGARPAAPAPGSSGTVQLHLAGPGGGAWHAVCEAGRVSLHPGQASEADVEVTATADDWSAIRRGERNLFQAWTGGRLQVTGDATLFQQLAESIVRAWDA